MNQDYVLDHEYDVKYANGMNVTENRLYRAMKVIGLKPIPQYKISWMTEDFAFPFDKIVIAINGPYHEDEEQRIKDAKRWFALRKEGWRRKTFDSERAYGDPYDVAYSIKGLLRVHGCAAEIEEAIDSVKSRKLPDKRISAIWDRLREE